MLFFAHLDTVPHDGPIEVVARRRASFAARGETILGADNKAAVTVLSSLPPATPPRPPPVGIELVFTVAEEDGLRGAKALDARALRSPFGFVLDHATPDRRGDHRRARPTSGWSPSSRGSRRTPGSAPRTGAARSPPPRRRSRAMELGRLDEETTANVGVIEGGSASNVVAGHCRIEGEARSSTRPRAERGGRRDGRRLHLGGQRARLRRRRRRRRDVPRLPDSSRLAAAGDGRGRRSSAAGIEPRRGRDRRRQRRQRAASPPASTRCCSPTGPRPTTPPRRASRPPSSTGCSTSARRSSRRRGGVRC